MSTLQNRKETGEIIVSVILWLAFICAATIGAYNSRGELVRSVTRDYRDGAIRWVEGRDLYSDAVRSGHSVIYLPQSYIVSIPFTLVPGFCGELLWRLVAVGLWGFAMLRLAQRLKRCVDGPHYFWFSLLAILLAMPAARCGQYTLPLAATMLLASMALFDKRWNAAALWLFLGLFLKPHIVAIFLLTVILFAPMRSRLVVAIILFAVFPFFFRDMPYVLEQYRTYPQVLKTVAEVGEADTFASLYQLAKFCQIELPAIVWTLLRVSLAALVFGLCFRLIQRRNEPYFLALWYFSLPVFYLLLMNARTENNSYAILAPLLLSYWTMEFRVKKNIGFASFLIFLLLGLVGHYEIGKFFTTRDGIVSICPFLTLVFLAYLGFRGNVWSFADRNVTKHDVPESEATATP